MHQCTPLGLYGNYLYCGGGGRTARAPPEACAMTGLTRKNHRASICTFENVRTFFRTGDGLTSLFSIGARPNNSPLVLTMGCEGSDRKVELCIVIFLCSFGIRQSKMTPLPQREILEVGPLGISEALQGKDDNGMSENWTFPHIGSTFSVGLLSPAIKRKSLLGGLPSLNVRPRNTFISTRPRGTETYPGVTTHRQSLFEDGSPIQKELSEKRRRELRNSEDESPALFSSVKQTALTIARSGMGNKEGVMTNYASEATSLEQNTARRKPLIRADKIEGQGVSQARSLPNMSGVRIGSSSNLGTGAAATLPEIGKNPSIEPLGNANFPVIGPVINTQYEVTERAKLLAFLVLEIGEEGQYKASGSQH
ncbi:hypothetical protein V5799_025720 [Amblyomma americanum]|uniref:Uncharacterized protein n=1 Tax=Amblyomma americanum TaxID=6943 RepID=A0AAQ4E8H5_AMBAM